MTASWSLYVAILAIANIAGCLWLLWWTAKKGANEVAATETLDHAFDGIREYNKPLPRWWLNLFYLTVAFAIAYLVLYPGLGRFGGTLGWSSEDELAKDVAAAEAKLAPTYAKYRDVPVTELAKNDDAIELGRAVFAHHCATCHGSDARGAKGFPNLTDDDWLYGGDAETVHRTILDGRAGQMPALGAVLGDGGTTRVALYVAQLSGRTVDATLAYEGKKHFDGLCAGCHGVDGKGNPALGAPNLTDDVWLYGGSLDAIAQSVKHGRQGAMPAHRALIGEDKARVAAAFVVSRSTKRTQAANAASAVGPAVRGGARATAGRSAELGGL